MRLWAFLLLGVAGSSVATMIPIDTPSSLRLDTGKPEWSWQSEDLPSASGPGNKREVPETSANTNAELIVEENAQPSVESVIEEILVSNRQGRNIEGYDQIYSDPNVKNALQLGNDTIARSYIRDKLCSLGLMNCENVEGRRPYYSPHRGIHPQDIIYAQPVTIKPVGRPLPAIPVKRPYGVSLKPGPPSPGFISSGPPSEVIYGSAGAAHPPISHFPPGLIGSYPGFKKPGPIPSFGSKPVYESGLLNEGFSYDGIDKKQISLRPSLGTEAVQQHVHHHYHHPEGAGGSSFVPSTIGQGASYGAVGTSFEEVSNAGGFQDFDDYKKAFKVKGTSNDGNGLSGSVSTNNYAEQYPVYEKPARDFSFGKADAQKTGKYFSPGNYVSSNAVQSSVNDYTASGSANNNYFNSYGNGNNNGNFGNDFSAGFASDCVCVPYDQCPGEHAGRKDDLFLPIDPRNLNKNIESENAEVVVNGTSTIVRVAKSTEIDSNASSESTGQEETESQGNVRSKRGTDESENIEGRKKSNGEGRLDASDLDSSKLNLKPTWGISFGLPQTGGSYPIGPHGDNVLVNPYRGYGTADQGINFGLVSVNPLLAVQFTKDEYGEKVVKPFVNLHVTPNQNLVQKLGHLLSQKKETLFDNYGNNYAPHYYPSKPVGFHEKPYYVKPPRYPPHHYNGHHETPYPHHHEYSDYYRGDDDDYDYDYDENYHGSARSNGNKQSTGKVSFPSRRKREVQLSKDVTERQFLGAPRACGPGYVCCSKRQPMRKPQPGQCGVRYTQGINGRIKTPSYVDGDAEFGEYPWQVAILKKDPTESVYVCGGTLISSRHILTAAHCIKTYAPRDLRVRLGEWDVNHDVEFYPYIERDVASVQVHPEFYAGTLYNDIAILRIDHDVDFQKNPHISPACLPNTREDFTRNRCWTTGWGKDAFGDFGKYQNILKEVDVPVVSNQICEQQMRRTRLGPGFNLHPGFICAGGEEGKDACKGDGGGPMVCERNGRWQLAGIVSWGIGCGQPGVPGVYARVSHYLDWIQQIVNRY
uniref:uncharacterized protein LOC117604636 isoform X1 n=1 Tax=Osmia lignaria TaxID=473952 RepID=UPI0014784D9C|nr:uncharacterized protein LOC117604636 isoform X1 [Osmia lignaria]XP_034180838.1 uncharacterized protein LOC117604636 isoform X1 [Osmia lignaria]